MNMDMVTLIVLSVAWSTSAAVLVISWVVKPRARALPGRWIVAGLLVMMSGGIVSQASHMLRWSYEPQLIIDGLTLIGGLVGTGCVVVGAIKSESGRSAHGPRQNHDHA
jgi:hypothetical protein